MALNPRALARYSVPTNEATISEKQTFFMCSTIKATDIPLRKASREISRENGRHFVTSPLVSPRNDV